MPEKILDDQYWTGLYQHNDTGWDLGYPSTPLREYIDQLTDKNLNILIPGCGNAYEAAHLLEKGFKNITLLDISSVLVDKLKQRFASKPVTILHADFFTHQEKYDLVLEQTFFCALEPILRKEYAHRMASLLKPAGRLVGVMFNRQFDESPPFGGSREEYMDLFSPFFSFVSMEPCYNSISHRAGNELFVKMIV